MVFRGTNDTLRLRNNVSCLGPCDSPRGVAFSSERGTPVALSSRFRGGGVQGYLAHKKTVDSVLWYK